jgi:transaldolase/glucose-6-phosphate isomerase
MHKVISLELNNFCKHVFYSFQGATRMNPLRVLQDFGQSFWLDYIKRSLFTNGELNRLIIKDGLRGITSNPTIFQKAILESSDYEKSIRELVESEPQISDRSLFEKLAIKDIQIACKFLRPIYEKTNGADGFVSFELPPELARNTKASIAEAHRLWKIIAQPNLMIKVPGTREGIPIIENLIAHGINVNVTLIFSISHYENAAKAYLRGLEHCKEPHKVSSVASFFLSLIDTIIDKVLETKGTPESLALRGKTAIASAKLAYKRFKEIFSGEKWEKLLKKGAKVQRPLWASTSTKNPVYSDVLYVEEIIGPQTVNTLPPKTINAFRDHGKVALTLEKKVNDAKKSFDQLSKLGINLNTYTEKLQENGVEAFKESIKKLLLTLGKKRQEILQDQINNKILKVGKHKNQVLKRLENWKKIQFKKRLLKKDFTLWFQEKIPELTNRLGWLFLPELMPKKLDELKSFTKDIRSEGFRQIVLLGMGGSSLMSEVFQFTFGKKEGYPELFVLDSSHPSKIRAIEEKIKLKTTLFLVSSKSGTTIETLSLFRYFWNKYSKGYKDRGQHFVAITDPNTPLVKLAKKKRFSQNI